MPSSPEPSGSGELLARVSAGEGGALEALYEQHVDGLYAFVFYRVGRQKTVAEDVVQDTFIEALGRLATYDPARGTVRAWLCTMSRNVIRRHLRHQPRGAEAAARWDAIDASLAELLAAIDGAPLSDEIIEREQTRDLVSMTVANLPDHYRHALEQKYVGGLTLGELAAALGTSEDAVKSTLARARRAFRETFLALSRGVTSEEIHEGR